MAKQNLKRPDLSSSGSPKSSEGDLKGIANTRTIDPSLQTRGSEEDLKGIANAETIDPSLQTRGSEETRGSDEAMRLMAKHHMGSIYMTADGRWFSTKELAERNSDEPDKVVTFKKD